MHTNSVTSEEVAVLTQLDAAPSPLPVRGLGAADLLVELHRRGLLDLVRWGAAGSALHWPERLTQEQQVDLSCGFSETPRDDEPPREGWVRCQRNLGRVQRWVEGDQQQEKPAGPSPLHARLTDAGVGVLHRHRYELSRQAGETLAGSIDSNPAAPSPDTATDGQLTGAEDTARPVEKYPPDVLVLDVEKQLVQWRGEMEKLTPQLTMLLKNLVDYYPGACVTECLKTSKGQRPEQLFARIEAEWLRNLICNDGDRRGYYLRLPKKPVLGRIDDTP